MKLHYICLLFSPVFGNYQIMRRSLTERLNLTNPNDRGLANFLVAGLDNFKNYGCWCYLDGAPGKGRSNPIDEFDLRCKTLHGGYECIQHDAISENDFDCVPWEQDYEFQFQNQDVTASCQNSNPNDNCASRACIVEQSFIGSLIGIFFSGTAINNDFKHGNCFDTSLECPAKTCSGQNCESQKECCGDYPNRAFYKSHGGNRQCCGGIVYDSNIMECCSSADQYEVKLVGSC